MRTVAVIGCSGFVGRHVTALLLSRGLSVRGTLRDARGRVAAWWRKTAPSVASGGAELTLHEASLDDEASLERALRGCEGVFVCAGTERQEPATIEVMFGGVRRVLDVAQRVGIAPVMIQSSTGSVNPPGPEPEVKHERLHWSDPAEQIRAGKYSPAAKTLLELLALQRMDTSDGALRVCIFNASMIAGPSFGPSPTQGTRFVGSILSGKAMAERVPDGSMSMIDVRDLAALQVAAFEQPDARGRYFAVKRSWHWRDILAAFSRAYPAYEPPPWPDGVQGARPTGYDLSRQHTLGVALRDLDEMAAALVADAVEYGLVA